MSAPDGSMRSAALARYGKYGAVAFEFVGAITAGVFVGHALDAWLGTEPWFVAAMTIMGTVAGFYRMIVILRHFERST